MENGGEKMKTLNQTLFYTRYLPWLYADASL